MLVSHKKVKIESHMEKIACHLRNKFVLRHSGIARVAAEKQRVAVQGRKDTTLNERVDGPFKKDGRGTTNSPIATTACQTNTQN